MKLDSQRKEYNVVVIGEEPHLAYNRVGLSSFFEHRVVENLYLNPKEWVRIHVLSSPRQCSFTDPALSSTPPSRTVR